MFRHITVKFQGEGLNFSPLSNLPKYPLVYGESAKAKKARSDDARYAHKLFVNWSHTNLASLKF